MCSASGSASSSTSCHSMGEDGSGGAGSPSGPNGQGRGPRLSSYDVSVLNVPARHKAQALRCNSKDPRTHSMQQARGMNAGKPGLKRSASRTWSDAKQESTLPTGVRRKNRMGALRVQAVKEGERVGCQTCRGRVWQDICPVIVRLGDEGCMT